MLIRRRQGGGPGALGEVMCIFEDPVRGLPQIVVIGAFDGNWGPGGRSYLAAAKAAHDPIRLIEAPQSGHFEMIDPDSSTWPLVLHAAYELLGMPETGR